MHCLKRIDSDHLTYILCCQDDNNTRLFVLGWITSFSEHTKFWVFHVIRRNDSARVLEHTDFVALPQEIMIPTPCAICTPVEPLEAPTNQFNHLLGKWPFDDSRHFLIRAGGDQSRFVVRAVALLSAKLSEKTESSVMIVIPTSSACRKQSKHLKETRDKPRKGKKTASQRVSKATA